MTANGVTDDTPAVVIFGLDNAKKPHGSYFTPHETDSAIKAAFDMGLCALRVTGEELATLAAKLPRGKLFKSGSAFVPFVNTALFAELTAAGEAAGAELVRPSAPLADRPAKPRQRAAKAPGAPAKLGPIPKLDYNLPMDWASIRLGSIVLTHDGLEAGYLPAIVVDLTDEPLPEARTAKLRFRDYEDYEELTRKLTELCLIHKTSKDYLPE